MCADIANMSYLFINLFIHIYDIYTKDHKTHKLTKLEHFWKPKKFR